MIRYLVVPIRVAEDVTFARYAIQAAHAREGAVVVLDLSDGPAPDVPMDWPAVLGEFQATTQGNAQGFRVVIPEPDAAQALPDPQVPGARAAAAACQSPIPIHADLDACFAATAPDWGSGPVDVSLTLPARLSLLGPVRRFLSATVREMHGEAEAFRCEILVDELGLNAVENSPSDRNCYDIRFRANQDSVEVHVTNDFDGSVDSRKIMQRRLQSFDDSGDYLGERGRGLFLIARLADGLQIRSVDGDRIRVSVTRRPGLTPATDVRQEERARAPSGEPSAPVSRG